MTENHSSSTDFIATWLDQLPEEEIQREIDALGQQISDLSLRLNTLREAVDMKRRFQQFVAGRRPLAGDGRDSAPPAPGRPTSIREAVLLLMAHEPGVLWPVTTLQSELIGRGWLKDSPQALRSLGAALSRMTSDGEIARVERGVYRFTLPSVVGDGPSPQKMLEVFGPD